MLSDMMRMLAGVGGRRDEVANDDLVMWKTQLTEEKLCWEHEDCKSSIGGERKEKEEIPLCALCPTCLVP